MWKSGQVEKGNKTTYNVPVLGSPAQITLRPADRPIFSLFLMSLKVDLKYCGATLSV